MPVPPHPPAVSGYEEHRAKSRKRLKSGVVVVSDTVLKGEREDVSGRLAVERISSCGHEAVALGVLANDEEGIREFVLRNVGEFDFLVLVGGTGLGERDRTIEAVRGLADKEVRGFGELFRLLTYQKMGPVAWLSRAEAFVVRGCLVFCTPGSPDAVETALEVVLPEVAHAVLHARGR